LSGIGLVRQVDASADARNQGNQAAFKGLLATALIGLRRLVLGRFRESIPDDSILLAIFAGEREDSSKKSKNRFRLATNPKPELSKKSEPFNLKFAEKASMKPNFFQLFHISLADGPQIAFSPMP
jgi:hypothetical protein